MVYQSTIFDSSGIFNAGFGYSLHSKDIFKKGLEKANLI